MVIFEANTIKFEVKLFVSKQEECIKNLLRYNFKELSAFPLKQNPFHMINLLKTLLRDYVTLLCEIQTF